MNHKVPTRVDGRFRLGDVLGSGSYAILKRLEGGIGIPCALWFGRESKYHALVLSLLGPSLHDLFLAHDRKFSLHTVVNLGIQLLSCLEYIHSNNYVRCDIKPQNVLVGLGHLKHTAFIIDFGIAKEYWDTATRVHIPFRQNQRLTGTPAFASINNHLGVDPGRRDDLESLTYMLIYLLRGSLPWITSDHEKLSGSSVLERKVNTTIEVLCDGIPVEFASVLIYTCSLAFSEDPDYGHLYLLVCFKPFNVVKYMSTNMRDAMNPRSDSRLPRADSTLSHAASYIFLTLPSPCPSSLQLASAVFLQIGRPATETNLSWIPVPYS
ncbi:putative casein kinase I [Suillus ampliporus]|nr:putative casein kinase I [Suillus ampliporus]